MMETSLTWLGRLAGDPTDRDWKRLLEVYGPLLRGWLVRSGVPAADHDDLIQEVLIVVVAHVADFEHRGPGAFRAWLRGILANHTRKFFRTRSENPSVDLDAVADPHSELGKLWDREHDEHLAVRALKMVQNDFAPATWLAFRRQVIDGRPPSEVARELDLSLNAVILAKSRVLKRLRSELQGLLE
ncbi:MAG TPA: sigma-70 family RNA polymerase sigma factor [Gemmataceae bacterium]|nr:sigma-70 family RNA polymerase sigma factor [Gemmataceae bacterium]